MTDADLDVAYTAVCRALGEVGPQQAQRVLAMLALGLMVRADTADDVLPLVASVRARCLAEPDRQPGDGGA